MNNLLTRDILICLLSFIAQLCLTLFDPMDFSPPGVSVHGILQARNWSGLPFSSPGESSQPRDQICIFCTAGRFFTVEPLGKPTSFVTWMLSIGDISIVTYVIIIQLSFFKPPLPGQSCVNKKGCRGSPPQGSPLQPWFPAHHLAVHPLEAWL